jgi:two-component system chemotaxis sensor kinase CheA
MSDPFKYFRLEARELVDHIGRGVLELEKSRDAAIVQRILRHAHTLKGAARVVRQPEIADRAHAIEDALGPFREDAALLPADRIGALLAIVDDIAQLVAALDAPAAPPRAQVEAPATPPAPEPAPAVHAELAELDALLDGVVETHTRLAGLRTAHAELERARGLCELVIAQLARSGADRSRAVAEELRDALAASGRGIETGIDHVDRELGQVREHAENLRLVPAETTFTALERTARDAAHALGRQVVFAARAEGAIRLDAPLLAAIQRAVVQLVRNAVAHGIEPAHERALAGKPAAGRIELEVSRRGRRVVFAVRDDGRGIDVEAVRAVVHRRGLAANPDALDAKALFALLLRGGITTSRDVTEVAGRGIGLDVVRAAIAQFGGEIAMNTAAGAGSTFELVVPAALAAIEALVVEAAGTAVLVPLAAVRGTRRFVDSDLVRTAHDESLVHGDAPLRYRHLGPLLGARATERRGVAVIVEAGAGTVAVGVDRLRGTAAAIVRPIPEVIGADPLIAGAALDANGTPQLVIDPDQLVAAARRERTVEPRLAPVHHPILVIDDSLTTRMLEKSILETAGYDVDTAVSAEDGLAAAQRRRYALFLVDVEMPGMDGFTFIERVRADPALRDIPAILVTSRASAEDRRRGTQVGANGYIVKSEFDQADLLARIERMVNA